MKQFSRQEKTVFTEKLMLSPSLEVFDLNESNDELSKLMFKNFC